MAAGGVLVGRGYVSIRPEFEGDWSRQVNARASSAGRSGGGAFGKAFGAALSGGLRGIVGGFGTSLVAGIAPAGAAVAALAPALATAGTAAGALKLGLSGVGEAFKAAFADSSAQASAAASATKAVEGAQRGLANAQRALAQARVDAAKRVQDAQRGVVDAERDLSEAQRDARDVQRDLNGARVEAARALEDMNSRLAGARLDERDAVLRLKEAEKELKAAQAKPGTSPEDMARLQLAYDRAKLGLQDQRTETKRLASDTAKANKAGVEGSEQVAAVRERIAQADENVADKERALADAQRGVAEARADGARQVADAQRAVADAAAAVADAQAAAAAQTSKLDDAMAKLAPNARSFVNTVRGLAPAWTDMRLGVQNALFKGLDGTVSTLGRTTIPVLKEQLTQTAGVWNALAKSAAGAVTDMAKTGMLKDILAGANKNLAAFKDTPRQLITAFGQLTVAAQPAFNNLMVGFSGAIASATGRLGKAFESGALKQALDVAFQILSQLGSILGDAFGAVGNILKAAGDAGAQALGVVGALFAELRRITAMPEIQSALRTVFASIAQIVGAIVPVLGAVVQAAVPLLAALAPVVAQLAQALGPALAELATALGKALMPVITALAPVVTLLGDALVDVARALMPLLQPIGEVIALIVKALMPVLKPIVAVVVQLVRVLVGPLLQIVQTLVPWITMLGELFGEIFGGLAPLLAPLVGVIGQLARMWANLFGILVQTLMRAIVPLVPVLKNVVVLVVRLATDLLRQLMPSFQELMKAGVSLLAALLPILPALVKLTALALTLGVKVLGFVLPPLVRLAAFMVGNFARSTTAVVRMLTGLVNTVTKTVGPAFTWLRDKAVKPAWEGVKGIVSGVWRYGIKPVFDTLKKAVGLVAVAFDDAKDAIKTAWDKLKGIAKAPVKFIIETIYNGGIVAVWNRVATAFGADPLKEFHPKGFARGGVLPGYTPGRDVHRFLSPTGGALELSGGEAIMRPEFTRAVGSGFVGTMNAIARSRGAEGVRAALAPVFGGNPDTPTDRTLRYADGGIFGWIKSAGAAIKGVGSAAWNKVKEGAAWLKDTLAASARAGIKHVVDPLLKSFPGMDTGLGRMLRKIPSKLIDALFGYSKKADDKGGSGLGGPKIQSALRWAKAQAGKPYIWGGVGPIGYDCSGFMGAIENVLRGQKPYSRRWATGAFSGKTAPPGWVLGGKSPFRVGITNAGVGHTAGTIGGVNVESRGGTGVLVGPRARGYKNSLFTSWYGFKPGSYDSGGFLQPGFNLAYNGTGRPEPVLTGAQFNALARTDDAPVVVEIHTQDRALAEFIDVRVHQNNRELAAIINAT